MQYFYSNLNRLKFCQQRVEPRSAASVFGLHCLHSMPHEKDARLVYGFTRGDSTHSLHNMQIGFPIK